MVHQRTALTLAALLIAGACSDGTAPSPRGEGPRFLAWEGGVTPHFTASGALAGTADALDGIAVEGPSFQMVGSVSLSLTTNKVSFWSVRGKERRVQIDYQGANGAPAQPFLQLTTYEPEYVPGRGYLAWGDSVLVTITVDPTNIAVQLEPHGLRFDDDDRSKLRLYYGGAGGDLNGDGLVDETDRYIESQLLGMWYQAGPDSPWSPMSVYKSLSEKSLTAYLEHFSGYAVSW